MRYRPEIDGLRAIAVVPVILFHAGFGWFRGGFIGVDIFFVISGYLITTILLNDLQNGRFSILDFYERRARRILPALFFVMALCLPFAWLWMLPSQMKDFSQSVVAVSFFASNFLFWRQSGYFDIASEERPLLHTWSLAVEEQYYLLFPVFLFFAWRCGHRHAFWAIAVLSAASLALCEWGWRNQAEANFYLAPTRAWELLAGSLSAFLVQERGVRASEPLSLIGLLVVIASIFGFSENTPFPSVYALLPVAGVIMIVLFASDTTLTARLLSGQIPVGIGLISYSAYLWHQPLFAFARIKLSSPGGVLMGLLALCSILFAYASWRFIEQPWRDKTLVKRPTVFRASAAVVLIFSLLGVWGIQTNGFQWQRFDEQYLALNDVEFLRSERRKTLGDGESKARWMLLGDSHADSLQRAFSSRLQEQGESALVGTKAGCPPALNLWRHDLNYGLSCHEHYSRMLQRIRENQIEMVLLSARFALFLNSDRFENTAGGSEAGHSKRVLFDRAEFRDSIRADALRHAAIEAELIAYIKAITVAGARVFVVTSIPEIGWNVPARLREGDSPVSVSRDSYNQRMQAVANFHKAISAIPEVNLLHSEEVLCDEDRCIASRGSFPLYYDTNHLSVYGAELLLDAFTSQLFP